MLNKDQIKLVQTAVRAAGIRTPQFDGRYRLLLGKYNQPNGRHVTSCKQLNNSQLEDLLALCEANGWRMPGKPDDFYRRKVAAGDNVISFAQCEAIRYLAGDLGWPMDHLRNFVRSQTKERANTVIELTPREGYQIIEAMKAIFNRENGTHCNTLNEIKDEAQSRNSDKSAESGAFALNGLQEARDGENQGR